MLIEDLFARADRCADFVFDVAVFLLMLSAFLVASMKRGEAGHVGAGEFFERLNTKKE